MSKKAENRWLTYNQLQVLDTIAKHGRQGVYLFYTDLSLATIRSLFKRGLIDTRRKGRIVATRAGKRRLKQPWPKPVQDRPDTGTSGSEAANGQQGGSEAV